MNAIRVGIDPGKSGGWAWRDFDGTVEAGAMPEDWRDLARIFKRIMGAGLKASLPVIVTVEQVAGYFPSSNKGTCRVCGGPCGPDGKHQKERQPGSAMFNFGKNTGMALGMLTMTSATVNEVVPRVWQKPFLPNGKQGKSGTDWKNELKAVAVARFPGVKVTLKTADALLLLAYSELQDAGGINKAEDRQSAVAGLPATGISSGMFVAQWNGKDYVFKPSGGNGVMKIRAADIDDLRTLPRNTI